MNKETIFLTLTLLFLNSCENTNDDGSLKSQVNAFFADKTRVNEIRDNAINKGDSSSYYEIHRNYFFDGREQEMLYISMIMANKYNMPQAYFDVYSELSHRNGGYPLMDLDERTRTLALYYLALSKEKGYAVIEYEWNQAYGNKPIPSSNSFLLELIKLDSMQVK